MRILQFRPETPPPGSTIVGRFDAQLTDDIRFHNLVLRRSSDGAYRASAPNLRGTHAATFSPEMARRLTAAAVTAFNETNGGQTARGALVRN